ncbi:ROK family protein [Szabonella alba]|uniref:ROK family protein n=1 Tax=Szabonella alba TaxID=2804194 RepID=A0A8K0VG29_9RHOB|nr:ROK family protein [Szabonella alba]MBL4919004.1 ROK family protein [Szabonella alba]
MILSSAPMETDVRDLLDVFDVVAAGRASTRTEVAQLLSARPTSVSLLVGELVARDLIRDSAVKGQGRGRPTGFLTENPHRMVALYIHIVSSTVFARAVTRSGIVLAVASASPPRGADNAVMAAVLRDLAGRALAALPEGAQHVATVCSLSGLLDVEHRLWCFTSRWPELADLDLRDVLAGFGPDPVLLRNLDAELAGRIAAEADLQAPSNVLLLHWGYGIGGAFATPDGIVNQGKGRFCEIGHWRLDNNAGRRCTCGNEDCLETVAALWALHPGLKQHFPDLPLDEEAMGPMVEGLALLDSAALREALRQTVRITTNLCRLLFPERIILTGPFLRNKAIFARFSESLTAAPILRSMDRPVVVQGQQNAALLEMQGALRAPFRAALVAILAA